MIESVVRYFVYYLDSHGIRCCHSFESFEDVLVFLADEYEKAKSSFGSVFVQVTIDSQLESAYYVS